MKNLDHLMKKGLLEPEKLTDQEKNTIFLQGWEIMLNFQTTEQLKKTLASIVNREEELGVGFVLGPKHVLEVTRMIEGKIALRELGTLQQRAPELGGFDLEIPPKRKKKRRSPKG